MTFHGYELEDIDTVAKDITETVEQLGVHSKLAVLALCRVVANIGTAEDLDVACQMIDDFADLPYEEYIDEYDGDGDDDGDY